MALPLFVGRLAGLPGLPRHLCLLLGLIALSLRPSIGVLRHRAQRKHDLLDLHLT